MKIIVDKKDITTALKGLTESDTSNADIPELISAVNDEYESGKRGTVSEILDDLNDCIGLKEFGIVDS